MKQVAWLIAAFVAMVGVRAQPFIHAHNDYTKKHPLATAVSARAYSIEADVFLLNDGLIVAHDLKDSMHAQTLSSMYLEPIKMRFARFHNRISEDTGYAPVLMIDIKENGPVVIGRILDLIRPFPEVFDRRINRRAVQVVISGDRGQVSAWTSYPAIIEFDGRPNETYSDAQLRRVAFISDSWLNYVRVPDSSQARIRELAATVHSRHKLLRLWGIPDNPGSWQMQHSIGVDIINTDKVIECRAFIEKLKIEN